MRTIITWIIELLWDRVSLWRIIYDIATDIKLLELPFFYYSREGGLSNNVALFSKGAFKRGKWKALSSSDSLNRERATYFPMHKRWLRFPAWALFIGVNPNSCVTFIIWISLYDCISLRDWKNMLEMDVKHLQWLKELVEDWCSQLRGVCKRFHVAGISLLWCVEVVNTWDRLWLLRMSTRLILRWTGEIAFFNYLKTALTSCCDWG